MKIEGLEKATRNLNEEIRKFPQVTMDGLFTIGAMIQKDAQQHVPVRFGKLRASAFTRRPPDQKNAVEVGFTASYAAPLHERVAMKWKGRPRRKPKGTFYWGPKGEAKFLEKAVQRAVGKLRKDLASIIGRKT